MPTYTANFLSTKFYDLAFNTLPAISPFPIKFSIILFLRGINPFPHNKILDQTKLKVFADDKLIVTKMIISVFDREENYVEKREIACISNFSFSHNVSKGFLPRPSKGVNVWEWVNPFPNKPWFLCVCSSSLLKTLVGKKKLFAISNFSFSHSVFYPFGELSAIFIKFEIVVCKLF